MSDLTRSEAHQLEMLFFDMMQDMLYERFLKPGECVHHSVSTSAAFGLDGIRHELSVHVDNEIVVRGRYENEPFMPDTLLFPRLTTAEDVGEAVKLTEQLADAYRMLDDHARSVADRAVDGTAGFGDTRAAISITEALSQQA